MGFHGDCLLELRVSSFFQNRDGDAAGRTQAQEGKPKSWSQSTQMDSLMPLVQVISLPWGLRWERGHHLLGA